VRLKILCGTNRFLWRFPSLRSVSYVIGYQRSRTW
jgi:hypothetical protein